MKILQLFPQPLYFSKLERELTQDELNLINKLKPENFNVSQSPQSSDNYILENKKLKNLKKELNKKIIDYFNKIVCPKNSITPYITQSWINYTKENQFHHQHNHSNSYVSGIFYVSADPKVDTIKFFEKRYQEIALESKEFNEFNATSWDTAVKTGDILLFPSTLVHGVDPKQGTNLRLSLSFNVFLKGKLGNNLELTELVLE